MMIKHFCRRRKYIEISEIKLQIQFGIASKDSSKVIGKKILVENCIWYDFAAIKKSFFNGGYIF